MIDSFQFADVKRRVSSLLRLGKIVEINKDGLVKVTIGEVVTCFLPVFSTTGDTTLWIPVKIGEQVLVLFPGGEMSQAVVLRSISYKNCKLPDDLTRVNFSTNNEMYIEIAKLFQMILKDSADISGLNLKIDFKDGITITVGGASIVISNDSITLRSGSSEIVLSSSGITLKNGASSINIGSNNISLASTSLSSRPAFCKTCNI